MYRKNIDKVIAENIEMRKLKNMSDMEQAMHEMGVSFEEASSNLDSWFKAMYRLAYVKTEKRKVKNRS